MIPIKWKDYWQNRAVQAELALIEIQAMLEGNDPLHLGDRITRYFNDVAKGDLSKYQSPGGR